MLGGLGESLATLLLVQGGNDLRSYGRTPYADIERRCVEAIMLARKTSIRGKYMRVYVHRRAARVCRNTHNRSAHNPGELRYYSAAAAM